MKNFIVLFWGKIRRFYLGYFRKGYVSQQLTKRIKQCKNCGACCRLPYKCPALFTAGDGRELCKVYEYRPRNCRIFPLDERDIFDRNIINPNTPCGFEFKDNEQ